MTLATQANFVRVGCAEILAVSNQDRELVCATINTGNFGINMDIQQSANTVRQVSDEVSQALQIRTEWMRLLGYCQTDIDDMCSPDIYPTARLEDELRELEAAQRIKANPISERIALSWARSSEADSTSGQTR